MKLLLVYKLLAAVMTVVVGATALGGGASFASAESLPGDVLYPVKLAVEDTRMASTGETQPALYRAMDIEVAERVRRATNDALGDPQRDRDRTCTPPCTLQQDRDQDRNQDRTCTPTCTPQLDQDRDRDRDRDKTHTPEPTRTPKHSRGSGGGH
jgi:hypothetical protein